MSRHSSRQMLKSANPSTIQDKFLVGYQGWFTCAGDGEPVGPGHHGWLHWFNCPIPDGGRPNTDVWPDVSSYSPSELFPAPGLKTESGEQTFLFSSRNAKTVQRHFHWMAEHGVDGAFLQRFAGQCDVESGNKGIMRIRDEVGERVREAAEREGRVFAIMYDVSGVPADRIQRILQRDWVHLVHDLRVLDSPNYLREKGKPVIALWGFGFDNSGHTPGLVREIIKYFRNTTPGGVYIMGGAPAHWRTGESDADRNPEFLEVWLNEFDAISPWTVGRYRTGHEADNFAKTKMKGDWELITSRNQEDNTRKVDYIPVVLPGGSGYNLSQGKWGFNDIKREGGRFLWQQIYNARGLGVRIIYGAMWDEYDEGTAFMPIVEHKRQLPVSDKYLFLSLDADGFDVPSDWYMRICGFAAEGLRNERRIHETFPVKELQDYWSSRPRYEEVNSNSKEFRSGSLLTRVEADGSTDPKDPNDIGGGQTYEEWLALQREEKEEVPPPPYTLEGNEWTEPVQPQTVTNAAAVTTIPEVSSNTAWNSPAVANVQPVASLSHAVVVSSSHVVPASSHAVPSSSYAAASPPVNMNTYPALGSSQVSAQSPPHPPGQRHSPQPHPPGGIQQSPSGGHSPQSYSPSAVAPHPQSVPPSQRHSPQLYSPSGVSHSVPPSQRHSPQLYSPSGVSPHPHSVPPSQRHSPQLYSPSGVSQPPQLRPSSQLHQPYPPSPTSGQPVQSYPPHAGPQHPQPHTSQQYPPTSGQGQHPQSYTPGGPTYQGYPSPTGESHYPPTGAPSQGYASPNAQSYGGPVRQGYPTEGYPSGHNIHNQSQDSVGTLANEFGRQSISGPSIFSIGGRLPSPPPLHPAHPNYVRRPSSSSLKPNRSQSQTGHHSAAAPPQVSNAASSSPGKAPATSTNRPRWPPVEWDSDTPPVPQFSGHRPSAAGNGRVGANLTRPQTTVASSYNPIGESTLRPTVSMSGRPSRLNTNANAYYQPPVAESPNSPFSFPMPFPSGPQYDTPSGYPSQTPYNSAVQGSWPGSGHISPSIAFPGGPIPYGAPAPYGGTQYSAGSPDDCEQFHHFREGSGGPYFDMASSSSSFPTPSEPPMPHQSYGYSSGRPSSHSAKHSSSGALGLALSAVDKMAGRKVRDQLESQVDNITHNKLFNKFTK